MFFFHISKQMKKKNLEVEAVLCREQEHMAAFHSTAFK